MSSSKFHGPHGCAGPAQRREGVVNRVGGPTAEEFAQPCHHVDLAEQGLQERLRDYVRGQILQAIEAELSECLVPDLRELPKIAGRWHRHTSAREHEEIPRRSRGHRVGRRCAILRAARSTRSGVLAHELPADENWLPAVRITDDCPRYRRTLPPEVGWEERRRTPSPHASELVASPPHASRSPDTRRHQQLIGQHHPTGVTCVSGAGQGVGAEGLRAEGVGQGWSARSEARTNDLDEPEGRCRLVVGRSVAAWGAPSVT
jgi:hypothetical protein